MKNYINTEITCKPTTPTTFSIRDVNYMTKSQTKSFDILFKSVKNILKFINIPNLIHISY